VLKATSGRSSDLRLRLNAKHQDENLGSFDGLDDLDELVGAVAVAAGEVDQVAGLLDDRAASADPATVTPRPRRNSSRPSSRSRRRERRTVLVLTSRTAARSLAGGRRSPGLASPSAIALRISAAPHADDDCGDRRSGNRGAASDRGGRRVPANGSRPGPQRDVLDVAGVVATLLCLVWALVVLLILHLLKPRGDARRAGTMQASH
jgi:hypothetical protein